MTSQRVRLASRRRLLRFLASSPLFAGASRSLAEAPSSRPSDPLVWAPRDVDKLIESPTQALDVFDFEPVMRKNCRRHISATWHPASMARSRCAPTARLSRDASFDRAGWST